MHQAGISSLSGIILRVGVSLLVFFLVYWRFGKKFHLSFFSEIKRAWLTDSSAIFLILAFEGVLAGSLGMLLFYISLTGGNLTLVMPLAFTTPLWGTLLAVGSGDEKLSLTRTVGILVTFLGIAAITDAPALVRLPAQDLLSWRIEYLALFTGICWGIGGFFGKKGMKRGNISSLTGITIRTLTAFLLLLIVSLSAGEYFQSNLAKEILSAWQFHAPDLFIMILFEGVLAGSIGMILFYIAMRKGELSLVLPLAFTSPFWSALLSIVSGRESISITLLIGSVLTLLGIIIVTSNYLPGRTK